MFCVYCGASNPDDAAFCCKCGKHTVHEHSAAPGRDEAPQSVEAAPEFPGPPEAAHHAAHAAAEPEPEAAKSAKGGRVLLAVGGVVLLLAIIGVAVAVNKGRGGASSADSSGSNSTPTPPPGSTPASDSGPPPSDPGSAPGTSPAPSGQGTIVGTWKTPVPLMPDTNLELTSDGHYHLKSALAEESGTYVFSDGNLQMQPDGLFDHSTITWQCQLSGDSMSVIEPDGAAHIYTRAN